MKLWRFSLVLLLAVPLLAFDPAKDVAVAVRRGQLLLQVPPGVHLKQRGFRVTLASSPGGLTLGPLPAATGRDGAGDPIWSGTVRVPLHGEGLLDPVALRVTFQPCTDGEDGLCYLPQHRLVSATVADFAEKQP
jgi:thiol:disulfide interchange protein DsbD